jgi:hypothetical protein
MATSHGDHRANSVKNGLAATADTNSRVVRVEPLLELTQTHTEGVLTQQVEKALIHCNRANLHILICIGGITHN